MLIFHLALFASVIIGGTFVFSGEAGTRSKVVIVGLVALSALLQHAFGSQPALVLGTLIQAFLCIGLLLYMRLKW